MTQKVFSKHKMISINAISSFFQVVAVGITYFFLYRYLLTAIGADKLGLWSLILASSSLASLGNMGIGGAIVKFVADSDAKKDFEKIRSIIVTGFCVNGIFVGVLCFILYLILPGLIRTVVSVDLLPLAFPLIPITLLSLFLNSSAGILASTLDGIQFIYIKNFIITFLTIFYLISVFLLVPNFGLLGVAYAQIIQAALMIISNYIIVCFKIPEFVTLRFTFRKDVVKELLGYGTKFQLMSICVLFFDPVTKYFLSKYGGLSITGFYEMANKLLAQFRSLIVSTFQVIVPAVANLHANGFNNIKELYIKWFPSLFLLTVILMTYIMAFSSYISVLWLGTEMPVFSYILIICSIGWFFNIVTVLAFFINLGTGQLNWNLASQVTLAVLNFILCYFFGKVLGGYFTLLGTAISLIVSSLVLFFSFSREYKIKSKDLFSRSNKTHIILAAFIIVGSFYFFRVCRNTFLFPVLLLINVFFVTLLMYINPGVKALKSIIFSSIQNKN